MAMSPSFSSDQPTGWDKQSKFFSYVHSLFFKVLKGTRGVDTRGPFQNTPSPLTFRLSYPIVEAG